MTKADDWQRARREDEDPKEHARKVAIAWIRYVVEQGLVGDASPALFMSRDATGRGKRCAEEDLDLRVAAVRKILRDLGEKKGAGAGE